MKGLFDDAAHLAARLRIFGVEGAPASATRRDLDRTHRGVRYAACEEEHQGRRRQGRSLIRRLFKRSKFDLTPGELVMIVAAGLAGGCAAGIGIVVYLAVASLGAFQ